MPLLTDSLAARKELVTSCEDLAIQVAVTKLQSTHTPARSEQHGMVGTLVLPLPELTTAASPRSKVPTTVGRLSISESVHETS